MYKLLLVALLVRVISWAQTPAGAVAGQVLNRDGRPAASVRVSAMAVPEAGAVVNSATALVSIAMTDSEGRYRLENVLPGRYYIMAGFVDLPTYYPGVRPRRVRRL
jgi:protocatechuate 3,4-dioxygenase beta subunit